MENDRTLYEEIIRTPNFFLEIGAEVAAEEGHHIYANFLLACLEWKITAIKIARTPLWRVFKHRKLFENLRHLEHELDYLQQQLDKEEKEARL